MKAMHTAFFRNLIIAALAPLLAIASATPALPESAIRIPYADQVGSTVANYVPVRPGLAAGGRLAEGSVGQLKAMGFKTIVDLRGPQEGAAAERRRPTRSTCTM